MGWSHNNNASNSGGPLSSLTVTLAVTAGDLIVAFGSGVAGQLVTFSDDVNGSYTAVCDIESDRPTHQNISCKVATTTATVTITGSGGGGVDSIHAANFSHSAGTIPGTVNNQNTAISVDTVNLTTTVADTLVVGFGDGSFSNDPGASFTAIAQTSVGSRITSEYQTALTNSAGSITVNLVVGTPRSILAAAFDPPSGATPQKAYPVSDVLATGWRSTEESQPTTAIDPETSFAVNQNVVLCYNPGGFAGNLIGDVPFTHNDGANVSTTIGLGNQLTGSGIAYWPSTVASVGSGPYTFTIFVRPDASNAVEDMPFSNYVLAAGTGISIESYRSDHSGRACIEIASSGFGATTDLGLSMPNGTLQSISVRCNGDGTFDFFVAGAYNSTSTPPGTHSFDGGTLALNANASGCTIPFIHLVKSALTNAQIAALHANPWTVFSRSTLYPAVADGSTGTADHTTFIFPAFDGDEFDERLGYAPDPDVDAGFSINIGLRAYAQNSKYTFTLMNKATVIEQWTETVLASEGDVVRAHSFDPANIANAINYNPDDWHIKGRVGAP